MRNRPEWLSNAVFYEIYPQSFLDTDGDGIGNINGITEKLPYIRNLGCNAIWLKPLAYFRTSGDEKILVVINPTKKEWTVPFEGATGELLYSLGEQPVYAAGRLSVPGGTACFWEVMHE